MARSQARAVPLAAPPAPPAPSLGRVLRASPAAPSARPVPTRLQAMQAAQRARQASQPHRPEAQIAPAAPQVFTELCSAMVQQTPLDALLVLQALTALVAPACARAALPAQASSLPRPAALPLRRQRDPPMLSFTSPAGRPRAHLPSRSSPTPRPRAWALRRVLLAQLTAHLRSPAAAT